jgi:thiol:disulfide interchange protein
MANHAPTRRLERRRRPQSKNRVQVILLGIVALIAAGMIAALWQTTQAGSIPTGKTNLIEQQGNQPGAGSVNDALSENDVAGLQSAEKGVAGRPVLVWFHADW